MIHRYRVTPSIFLLGAILCEVAATTCLKISDGFTRPLPTATALLGYASAFYLLSLALRTIPLGVAYALWCGFGIVAITIIGRVAFRQILDAPAMVGIGLILIGVAIINLWSRAGQT